MTIVVTGGGSGGHITPILAVASELKRLQPAVRIVYVGQKGDALADIPAAHPAIDEVRYVQAGKLRRYNGEGWKQLLDLPTQAKNMRDVFRVLIGLGQSYFMMRKLQPSVIFSRGGFVSVPVCLGGWLNRVPFVTHDSDSVPSLANRLIARWATLHAVALPEELYPYPIDKTVMVGIPLSSDYQPVEPTLQAAYRQQLKINPKAQLLLITGGGNGARRLNEAVVANAAYLLKQHPKLVIVHIAGRALQAATEEAYDKTVTDATARKRIRVEGFVSDFYRYSGAADVIIARGGATNLAEFAAQGKTCIIIPAAQLVGGHQVKNAQALADRGAVVLFTEEQAEQERRLAMVVGELLDDDTQRDALAKQLSKFARPHAAKQLAELLLEQTKAAQKSHAAPS